MLLDRRFFMRTATTGHTNCVLESYKAVYARSTMVLFSRKTGTPLAALTLKTDDVGCLSMLTSRPAPGTATEPYFQGMVNMPDQSFSFTISNLSDNGMINFNILHTPHRVSDVDPGPSYGMNQVNELHSNQSYTIEADQRNNRKMILRGKTKVIIDAKTSEKKEVSVTVDDSETSKKPTGLYFYLSVVADKGCEELVEKFAEGTVWKVTPGFVRRAAKPPPLPPTMSRARISHIEQGETFSYQFGAGSGGFSFGAPATAPGVAPGAMAPAPASGGFSFAGAAPAPTAGGGDHFGAQAPAPTRGGLFGLTPAPAPAAGGGLFGSATATAAPAPAPLGGGLFGSTLAEAQQPILAHTPYSQLPAPRSMMAQSPVDGRGWSEPGESSYFAMMSPRPFAAEENAASPPTQVERPFMVAQAAPAGFSAPPSTGFPPSSNNEANRFAAPVNVGSTQAAELKYGRQVEVRSSYTGHDYAYEHCSEPTVLCMSIWKDMKFLGLPDIEKELETEVEDLVKNEGKFLIDSLNAVFKADTCVIDLESEADTIICTCGHQCIHHTNTANLRRCPMCRSPIAAFVRANGILLEW